MSEYQYYEWQTLDRRLTAKEQAEVSRLSSHITVSATRAWVDYSWGDFKHDPREVLVKYFDAFIYMANWGSFNLMFRFPQSLIDRRRFEPYCLDEGVELTATGDSLVLSLMLHESEGTGEWLEGEGTLSSLTPLRNDLLLGDTRALYLAWLANMEYADVEEDELEPPPPAGLGRLTAPLDQIARFLEIDEHLLKVACSASADLPSTPEPALREAIARLPRAECDSLLWRLVQGELNLGAELRCRLQGVIGASAQAEMPRRTVGELLAACDRLQDEERQEQERIKQERLVHEMEALSQNEERTWQAVDELIQSYQAKNYQQAVALLLRLRDLAEHKGTQAIFSARIRGISLQYARRSSLMRSLQAAGLMPD